MMQAAISHPWRRSIFLFFAYTPVVTAEPRISLASAIAVAMYAPCYPPKVGHKTIISGTIAVAALKPTRPVPLPASAEATATTIYSYPILNLQKSAKAFIKSIVL